MARLPILPLALAIAATAALAESETSGEREQLEERTRGDVVAVPMPKSNQRPVELPRRSMTMAQVEERFGEPVTRHSAVGEPPITRWDYPDFSVFFEHNRVLHAVVPGDFPEIRHRDELISER